HGDQPQRRMHGRDVETVGGGGSPQRLRQCIEQIGKQASRIEAEDLCAEIGVDRLAQRHEPHPVFRLHGSQVFTEQCAFGAEVDGGRGKTVHLPRRFETVDPARLVVAEHDAVGDIESQGAPGEAMRCPRKTHSENITGKSVFASYYFEVPWSISWPISCSSW